MNTLPEESDIFQLNAKLVLFTADMSLINALNEFLDLTKSMNPVFVASDMIEISKTGVIEDCITQLMVSLV